MSVDPKKMIATYEAMENGPGGSTMLSMGFRPAWASSVPNGYHWTDGRWFATREDFEPANGLDVGGLDTLWWSGDSDCHRGSLRDLNTFMWALKQPQES